MNRKSRWILIIALLAIMIIAIAVPTFAIWSAGSGVGGNSEVDLVEDLTYRYLVLDGVTSAEKHFCMTYDMAGYYKYNADYNVYDEEVDTGATSFSYISVIGYTGTLGEYESLVIPDTIIWKEGADGTGASHNDIPITHINMQSPAAFPTLKGIKSVVIGANVTNIDGVSFSFMPMLSKVYFKMSYSTYSALTSNVTISSNAFVGNDEITRYFWDSSLEKYRVMS